MENKWWEAKELEEDSLAASGSITDKGQYLQY